MQPIILLPHNSHLQKMSLFTFYTFFGLQMFQRVIIIGGERFQHANSLDQSCVLNSCGTRDETGIVTICEDTEIGDECPNLESLSEASNSKSYKTFCEETNDGSCRDYSSSAASAVSSSHEEIMNKTAEKNFTNSNAEIMDKTVEKNYTNSFAHYNENYEIRAQLLVKLQELMENRPPTNWPRPTEYFFTAADTLYHVTIQKDCSRGKVSYNDNRYLPVRIKINEQLNQIDSKISLGEERHRRLRKRYSPRQAKKPRRFRQAEDQEGFQHNHIDEQDKERLQHVLGKKTYSEHESDLEQVGKMGQQDNGAIEHKLSQVNNPTNENMEDVIDEARMNAVNEDISSESGDEGQLDSGLVKNMLKELLHKLDEIEHDPKRKSTSHGHCNTHGLWLSTVAGAAIELLPDNNGVINTKIVELPQPPEGALINSQWTGTGMISKESPTTITIVFQEHIPHNNDDSAQPPRTAVFVGQCLVCDNSPMLQGTWILFPNSQNCFPLADKRNSPSSDIMYRIRR